MNHPTYPIPSRLNRVLLVSLLITLPGLLWFASSLPWQWSLLIGLLFACMAQTSYALLHEATHGQLHPNRRLNTLMGRLCAMQFPTSFTLMRHAHIIHHCYNRSDHEIFDYYYPHDNLLAKRIQWYGIISGLYWPLIPLGGLMLALMPSLLRNRIWQRYYSTNALFSSIDKQDFRRIRLECLAALGWFTMLFLLLDLQWLQTLILYGMAGFLWSTRQYVTHAFTPRNVVHGSLNLQTSWLMDKFLLHGGWDLVHHQNPHLAWIHLPSMAEKSKARVPFWPQYLRLWRGPQPCTELPPEILVPNLYDSLGERQKSTP